MILKAICIQICLSTPQRIYLSSSGMDHTTALVYNLEGPSVTIQILTRICRTQRSRLLNLVRNHFSPPVPLCPDFCLNYFKRYDCLSTLTPSPLILTELSKMIYKHSPKGRGWDCSCDPTDSFTKYNQTYQVKHSLNTIKVWKSVKSSEKSNRQNYVQLIGPRELTRLL